MRAAKRIVITTLALLAAGCGRDANRLIGPEGPSASTWTRTYTVGAATYVRTAPRTTVPASYSAGYVTVELVPDDPSLSAFQIDEVQADGSDLYSYFKPANYSLRLTAVVTLSNCTFSGWTLGTPTPGSPTVGESGSSINMDDFHPYSQVRATFLCT